MRKKIFTYNKNVLILIFLISLLTGCTTQTTESLPTISDMRENAITEEKEIVEISRLTNAEAMVKHYGGNLYFEDYGTLSTELNAYFKENLEKEYSEHADSPVFVDPHIEFYNLTLKRLKDGEINFEDVYGDLKEHVKVFKIDILDYAKKEDAEKNKFETKFGFYWFDNLKEKYEKSGMRALDIRYIDVNPLKVSSEQGEQTYSSLYKGIERISNIGNHLGYSVNFNDGTTMMLSELKEKYNEDFQIVGSGISERGYYSVAPKDNLEFYFDVDSRTKEQYLSLMAQYYMSKEVERIIKEEGLEEHIGYLIMPDDRRRNIYKGDPFKRNEIEGNELEFLNDVYQEIYDITLIYLTETEEEINKTALGNVVKKIHSLVEDEPSEAMLRTVVMVYFYTVDVNERKIAVELFKKNSLNAHTFRDTSEGMSDYYSNMYKDRIENDAYHFLDTFADKREYMLLITNGHFNVEEETSMEIFELAKKKSLFEAWEE